jgi:filamentous hemagglutinin family protein
MARKKERSGTAIRPKVIAVAVAACFGMAPLASIANPTGPTVVSGSASFAAQGNALTITNSHNAIINWQGFSIGINELTRFLQPSVASAVLNRVIGSGGTIPQSVIDGILSSNGHVYLLNPNGIVFGPNAQIDVAGLVASSLDISNQDFLNGKLRFMEVPNAAGVANHGIIETASGGRVLLVAPNVENTGIIRSPQGEILLAAGKQVELVSEENPYVTVKVTADAESAVNVGSLIADSGRIGMYGGVVTNTGVAAANAAVVGEGGQIQFVATRDVTVAAGSTVSANGDGGGNVLLQAQGGTTRVEGTVEAKGTHGSGGTVDALGVRVGVLGSGVIDVSGDTGGGTVRVGGDYQGKNTGVQNAQETTVGSDGVIRADAGSSGDGGRVIVWADDSTAVHGSVSVRGGAQSGDGGFVETSGKQSLTVAGARIDASAPNGSAGGWLLDPTDYTIDAAEAATIQSNFASTAYVQIVSDGSINYQAGLNLAYGGGGGGSYYNYASNNINLNANTITTDRASVYLEANSSYGGAPSGTGSITSTAAAGSTQITTNGGYVELTGQSVGVGGINTAGAAGSRSGGSIYIEANPTSGTVNVGGPIVTRGAPGQAATATQYAESGGWGGYVYLSGATVSTGSIDTSGGAGGAGYSGAVDPSAYGGIGRGGWGGGAGWVDIYAGGPATITTGPITARGGDGGSGGNVSGDATGMTYAYLDAAGGGGGPGGSIYLSSNGAVTVNGTIDATGGNGGAGGSANLSGAYGGQGSVYRYAYALGGDGGEGGAIGITGSAITTSSIIARGGNGAPGGSASVVINEPNANAIYSNADATGGWSGYYYGGGYQVALSSAGAVNINGTIDITGGNGANGGTASISASGGSSVTNFSGYATAEGGWGAPVTGVMIEGSSVTVGAINMRGGSGANGGTASVSASFPGASLNGYAEAEASGGGAGYYGGYLPIESLGLYVRAPGAVAIASVDARGGDAASGGSASTSVSASAAASYFYADAFASGGFFGGQGGFVDIVGGASVTTAGLSTQGGFGGNGGSASIASNLSGPVYREAEVFGGDGGLGGPVYIGSDGPIATGGITTNGGNGGLVGSVALSGNSVGDTISRWGAHGGDGGYVYLDGASVTTGVVTTRGGNGTPGGPGGEGGSGGSGGDIGLIASGLVTVGPQAKPGVFATVIDASGGSGAAGGPPASPAPPGGAGGSGGFVNLDGSAVNVNGIILSAGGVGGAGFPGGNGGAGGALTLATTGSAGVITFYNGGWDILGGAAGAGAFGGLAGLAGSAGVVDVLGTLVFVILDPLLVPEIQAAVQQVNDSVDKSIPYFEEPNGNDDEDDKLGKKGTAVCKPRSS